MSVAQLHARRISGGAPGVELSDPINGKHNGNGNGKHNGNGREDFYVLHPLVEMIPGLPQDELNRMAEDIRRIGRSAPFLTAGGKIMERDRFLACKAAKVAIEFEPWDGFDSLVETIARLNLPRLYLTESQRAAVAVPISEQISTERSDRRTAGLLTEKWQRQATSEIASKTAFSANATVVLNLARRCNSPETQVGDSGSEYVRSVELAAQICHVSPAYITLAKKLRDESRDIFDMVLAGKLNLSQAKIRAFKSSRSKQLSNIGGDLSNRNRIAEEKIIVGDCIAEMKKMPDGKFTVIFADPPYNNRWKYDSDPTGDNLPQHDYLNWCDRWMRQCVRLLSPRGSLFILIDDQWAAPFDVHLRLMRDLHRRNTVIWWEKFGSHQTSKFTNAARYILYFTRSPSKFVWHPELIASARIEKYGDSRGEPKGKIPDNVWEVARVVGSSIDRVPFDDMPPQIPEEICRRCILAASDPGDWVLDPFLGNGTTGRAARVAGRKFTGIERSKKYAEQAAKWVQAHSISTAEARP